MPIPSNPSILSLIQEGMKKALGRTATSGEQARALDEWTEEIKNEIWMESPTHELLENDTILLTTSGIQNYSIASNISDFESLHSMVLLDGDVRDTAQTGGNNTITLSADDSSDEAGRTGREILLIANTGSGQLRTIIQYNSSTKVATVDSNWTTNPDSTTEYVVLSDYVDLWNQDEKSSNLYLSRTNKDRPSKISIYKDQIRLFDVPDKIYGLKVNYWVNIQQVDTDSTAYTKMLRKWRSLFTEGFYIKALQDDDDPRYIQELPIYSNMISKITSRSLQVGQVKPQSF
ncbi:MAG: hypothetical protein ACE5GU_13435 [Candidatus Scalinduaceae bacterium]